MIKLAGIWERGWNTPIKEIDLWEMIIREFEVHQLYMTPISGIDNGCIIELPKMEQIISMNPSMSIVFVTEKTEETLFDFEHPKDALYIFGRVGPDCTSLFRKGIDKKVKIETTANKGLLWPHQAAGILLYDRLKKSWQ